jgi:hypothetical protein
MKLGATLVSEGAITKQQLDLALRSQLIVGGHLGTNLIELGYVDEETLGLALSKATGVPYAQPHFFENIKASTIQAVPRNLAEEYEVVPLGLEAKRIHIAIVNPKNLHALDELAFATGRKLVPWIAPEVRIVEALERYYGVSRRSRYIALSLFLNEFGKPDQGKRREIPRGPAEIPPIPAAHAWQDASTDRPPRESAAPQPTTPKPKAPAPRSTAMSLDELGERYSQAASRDDLAQAVLDFGVGRAKRMLLTLVRDHRASIWEESGFSLKDKVRCEAGFDVTSESLVSLLMGNDHYRGAFPREGELERFFGSLGVELPEDLLLIPVHVNDRLVTIALIDGGPRGRIQGHVDDFLKAFRLFGTGVGIVILRQKLRGSVLAGAGTR